MSKLLIPTQTMDVHAVVVQAALRDLGHEAVLLHSPDFPTLQSGSIHFSPAGDMSWKVSGSELSIRDEGFDTVWYRRPTNANLPLDMHEGDRKVAERGCNAYLRAFWHLVAPEAYWINPLSRRERARAKPVQLREAMNSGLRIAETLFSNDPEEIRSFLGTSDGDVIFKSHHPAAWRTPGGGVAKSYTAVVTLDDLPDDEVLRLTSGIFQTKLDKAFEVRVTAMGDRLLPAKVLFRDDATPVLDWRSHHERVRVEPIDLPTDIEESCHRLMERLGLVFGCFDFAVTPEGEYVFLEINEMGQFLWVESMCPEIPMLRAFCELVLREQTPVSEDLSLARYSETGSMVTQQLTEKHVWHMPADLVDDQVGAQVAPPQWAVLPELTRS